MLDPSRKTKEFNLVVFNLGSNCEKDNMLTKDMCFTLVLLLATSYSVFTAARVSLALITVKGSER